MIFVLQERRFGSAKNANTGATYPVAGRWKIALNGLQITPPGSFSRTTHTRRKDRQRHPLYLTVFWFRLACISKKPSEIPSIYQLPAAQTCSTPYLFPLYFNQL